MTRLLLLGPTGVNKVSAVSRLLAEGNKYSPRRSFRHIDFEHDHLGRYTRNFASYLSQPDPRNQAELWHRAWRDCSGELASLSGDIVLSMHGVLVRSFYGVRQILDVHSLCNDFAPDLVVTLIDDIYNMWWRTEERAQGDKHVGQPTLEQLLMARRAESTLGDAVVCCMMAKKQRRVKHITLSTNHPARVLSNLFFQAARSVYLSFPISKPREALATNSDPSLVQSVNAFHSCLCTRQSRNDRIAIVSPLAIDELPLKTAVEQITNGAKQLTFDPGKSRWPIPDLWGDQPMLFESAPSPRPIPVGDVRDVIGGISTDVGWRDNRLVLQSDALAVFCPVMPDREGNHAIARGVKAEIDRAIVNQTRVHIFQNPKFDPDGLCRSTYGSNPGSMGDAPIHELVSLHESETELVESIERSL